MPQCIILLNKQNMCGKFACHLTKNIDEWGCCLLMQTEYNFMGENQNPKNLRV